VFPQEDGELTRGNGTLPLITRLHASSGLNRCRPSSRPEQILLLAT
jgi:hypothetical protein